MAGTGVIGVRMGDHRAVHRPRRIDEEAAGLAPEPLRHRLSQFEGCGMAVTWAAHAASASLPQPGRQ